jgi:hypothetical protein
MTDFNPNRLGRVFVLASISSLLVLDFGLKLLLLLSGSIRVGQVVGTLVSVTSCWFLWRGSKVAYWFLVCCVAFGIAYTFMVPGTTFRAIFIVWALIFLVPLLMPASRKFLSVQRARFESAARPMFGLASTSESAPGYPDAVDASLVGTYSGLSGAGAGFVWDEVLEYRVWCHPERGAPAVEEGNDYYHSFATHKEALEFSQRTKGAEEPLALIRQAEYISEPEPGQYFHVKEERITEWPVEFLRRPRRTANTIPDFLSPTAPKNRLDILRGLAR